MSRDFGEHLAACAGDGVDVSVPVPHRAKAEEADGASDLDAALEHAETPRATAEEATLAAEVYRLQGELAKAERQRDNEAAASFAALRLVSDIRFALGDNGKRMQDELVAWCKEIAGAQARVADLEQQVQLDDKAKRVMVQWSSAEKRELEARNARLVAELQNIANAKPHEWGEERDQFQAWAQNRARHTLAALADDGAPHPDTARLDWLESQGDSLSQGWKRMFYEYDCRTLANGDIRAAIDAAMQAKEGGR
jgi:hypothetical protein